MPPWIRNELIDFLPITVGYLDLLLKGEEKRMIPGRNEFSERVGSLVGEAIDSPGQEVPPLTLPPFFQNYFCVLVLVNFLSFGTRKQVPTIVGYF